MNVNGQGEEDVAEEDVAEEDDWEFESIGDFLCEMKVLYILVDFLKLFIVDFCYACF